MASTEMRPPTSHGLPTHEGFMGLQMQGVRSDDAFEQLMPLVVNDFLDVRLAGDDPTSAAMASGILRKIIGNTLELEMLT